MIYKKEKKKKNAQTRAFNEQIKDFSVFSLGRRALMVQSLPVVDMMFDIFHQYQRQMSRHNTCMLTLLSL